MPSPPPYYPQLPVQRGKHIHGLGPVFAGGVDSTPPTAAGPNNPDFWLYLRTTPGNPATLDWAVGPGYLGYGDVPDNPITVEGVGSDPALSDATWTTWSGVAGYVWLEAPAIDLTQDTIMEQVGEVDISADDLGDTFDPTEQAWQGDGACYIDGTPDGSGILRQNSFRRILAKFTVDDDGNLQISMRNRGPLEMVYDDQDGAACVYPRPQ
jgi:hypothetical protein